MLKRRDLLAAIGIIALVGAFAFISFSGVFGEESDAESISADSGNLAAALDNAESGDTITLDEDATLDMDTTIRTGVTLEDGGFTLSIPENVTLSIEGTMISTGNLYVYQRGTIAVASGGILSIENEGNVATISGSLKVYIGGSLTIGQEKSSKLECAGNSRLMIEGALTIGKGVLNSAVDVRTATIAGTATMSGGSSFRVHDILTIGYEPTSIEGSDALVNNALINGDGKILLVDSACVLVYGKSSFDASNIQYQTKNTQFIMMTDKIYATEYIDLTAKRTVVMPSTASLTDYELTGWEDSSGNIVKNDSSIQIGSGDINGVISKRTYKVVLTEDKSIRWVVNGLRIESSKELYPTFGTKMTISVTPASGYSEIPSIKKDGMPYEPDTPFEVTRNIEFTTSNNYPASTHDNTLMYALLVLMGILILLLMIFVFIQRERERNRDSK